MSSQDPSQLLLFPCSSASCTTTTLNISAQSSDTDKRSSIKPLVRTLSSPLPLGRGLSASSTCYYEPGSSSPFEGGALNLTINNNTINNNYNNSPSAKGSESSFSSNIQTSQQQDRKFLLQHIRQTVITRVSSKQKLAAAEAAAASAEVCGSSGHEQVESIRNKNEERSGQEKMEEEEVGQKEGDEDVDVENISSSPSKSSSYTSNQQQPSSTHLTPKAKFLRQFLQDNISSLPGGSSSSSVQSSVAGVGYSQPTSCVPVTTSTSDQRRHQ